jgi:hypothetical protein
VSIGRSILAAIKMAATTNGDVESAASVNAPAKTFDTILVLDFG